MKRSLAVVGVGSAGILSLSHYLYNLNSEWIVTSISDNKIPILGIGESTNPSFINTLGSATGLTIYDELANGELDSTVKYGTMYKNWYKKDCINPLIGSNVALHINTFKLKDWAFKKFNEKWPKKFKQINGNVKNVYNEKDCAVVIVDEKIYKYDFVIDCRGFPNNYEDYTILENPTNQCLVHNVLEGSDPTYTGHVATEDGWMFVVPLKNRTSYGYLFNNNITDTETAKNNFSKQINVSVKDLDNTQYSFKSYYSNNPIDGRIIKNGNKAVFFEPMFANSLVLYDKINRYFFDYILGIETQDSANKKLTKTFRDVRQTILFFYHKQIKNNSKFWEYAIPFATKELYLDPEKRLESLNQSFEFFNRTHQAPSENGLAFPFASLEIICNNMDYKYSPSLKNSFIRNK
jgi:hypothetical protein